MTLLDVIRRRLPDYPPYYEAPGGQLLRMDQNVNLLGPHPAVRTPVDLSQAHLYPTRDNSTILQALAKTYGLTEKHYFVANGSDEVLDWFVRVLLPPGGRLVTPTPTYGYYSNLARTNRVALIPAPRDAEFHFTADSILAQNPGLILIANPNNPTGTFVDPMVIGQLLKGFDGPVLLDEAYAEFAQTSLLPMIERHPNLLVARTLSKAYGLAGLRVGFGAAHPDVAELVRRAKHPFSLNIHSEAVAVRALADPKPVHQAVEQIGRERTRLQRALGDLGFRVVPSQANFLLTLPPIPSEELYDKLRQAGILARIFPQDPALRDYLRFTIGQPEQNGRLLEAIRSVLESAKEAGPA